MFLPKVIKFKIDDEEYELRCEYIWFSREKIFPRYRPTYFLTNSKGETIKLKVKTDADYKELLDFIVSGIKENLIKSITNLFTKLNTIRS